MLIIEAGKDCYGRLSKEEWELLAKHLPPPAHTSCRSSWDTILNSEMTMVFPNTTHRQSFHRSN